jgi:hypothetical protein
MSVVAANGVRTSAHDVWRRLANSSRFRRIRVIVAAVSALLAITDIIVVTLLISEAQPIVRLGFRVVRPHDVVGAAELAAVLCGLVAVLLWHRRALRRVALIGLGVMAVVAATSATALSEPTFPVGDRALLESYTLLATKGQIMVGPYSRFGWHHPGPLYFWLAAPFYALSNYRSDGLEIAALAINAVSVAIVGWIAIRFASALLQIALLAGLAVYLWRIDTIFMSVWNPYIVILPTIAVSVTCAAILTGQIRLLPLAAVLGSFIAQTHIALLPYAVVLIGMSGAYALARDARAGEWWLDSHARRVLNLTGWILLLVWSGPIAQQLASTSGNLGRLWSFFLQQHSGPTFAEAYVAWAHNVCGIFVSGFDLAGKHDFERAASWPLVWAPIQTGVLVPACLVLKARKYSFDAALAAVSVVALFVGLWSVIRVVGVIPQYGIVWISGLGLLSVVLLVCAAAGATTYGKASSPSLRLLAVIVASALMSLVFVVKSWWILERPASFATRRSQHQVHALYDSVRAFLDETTPRKPLIRMGPRAWSQGAGIALQLQLAGYQFAVEQTAVHLFTDVVAPDGTEDAEITIGDRASHDQLARRPGNIPVGRADGMYVDAVLLTPSRRP